MTKFMRDSEADGFLYAALFALALSCVNPFLGMLVQYPLIALLVWRCDLKGIPALLILSLDKSNFFVSDGLSYVLRLGITWTPASWMAMQMFFYVVIRLLEKKFDQPTTNFARFWLLSVIPAAWISFQAKANGLGGIWSGPIMDFITPGLYFWGIMMGRSYEQGRFYFVKRMVLLLTPINLLYPSGTISIFTFTPMVMSLCLSLLIFRDRQLRRSGFWIMGVICAITALVGLLFGRAIALEASGQMVTGADEIGSTFSRMGIVAVGVGLVWLLRMHLSRAVIKMIPILMVIGNISLVAFVLITQDGNKARDVNQQYETFGERVSYKLFGDRAAVWRIGWDDTITPPFIFKDLRIAVSERAPKEGELYGVGMKLLPHNQYLTLLSLRGLWLGLVLSIFIIWIQVRAFRVMTMCPRDNYLWTVLVPVGAAIFAIVGTTGQSVLAYTIWGNGMATLILPGVVYGQWRWKMTCRALAFRN